MTPDGQKRSLAIWAVTPEGGKTAKTLKRAIPDSVLFAGKHAGLQEDAGASVSRLSETVREHFHDFHAHVFIMSTGIVVRLIGGILKHKTVDPAVVVVDDRGRFAISLVSGHIGGANELAETISGIIGATPVITTATDGAGIPAIDTIATSLGLFIENPGAIKSVSMALLSSNPVLLDDPDGYLAGTSFAEHPQVRSVQFDDPGREDAAPAVCVDHTIRELPDHVLRIRPKVLVVGIGCNRNTDADEMRTLLDETFRKYRLSVKSIHQLATVDIKSDEPGILETAKLLGVPVIFFSKEELNAVTNIMNPSAMAEKHIGVKSVCEAAAILGAKQGRLLVPKQKTANVTIAVAKMDCTS